MNRYIYTKLLAAATTLLFNFLDERNRVIFIANENNPSDRSSLNVKKKGREREGKKANAHFASKRRNFQFRSAIESSESWTNDFKVPVSRPPSFYLL